MTMPIIVYRPKFHLVPLDENGAPVAASLVDVSCDMSRVELTLDTPTTSVTNFCGTFQIPGDIEEGAEIEVTVNADTKDNWAPLVGTMVQARIYDRADSTEVRAFDTQIPANPALYGANVPGEARTITMSLPVLSSPVHGTVTGGVFTADA